MIYMKTILYIGGFELPDKNAAAHRVLSNAKLLRQSGVNVILIGVNRSLKFTDGLVKAPSLVDGFEVWEMPYPETSKQWLSQLCGRKELVGFLEQKGASVDGVICYNFPAIAMFRLFFKAKSFGAKAIPDITEWYSSKGAGLIFGVVKSFDTSMRIKFLAPFYDAVITTSPFMTSRYSHRLPVIELPTLFDSESFSPPKVRVEPCRQYVYVGSPFDPARAARDRSTVKERLDRLVDAFYVCLGQASFKVNIYGVSKKDFLRVYPEYEEKLNLMGDSIEFYGRVPNSSVRAALSQADFTVFFRDETRVTLAGFPGKFAESITAGIPVISNRHPSIDRYSQEPWALIANNSMESDVVKRSLELSDEEVEKVKAQAYKSHAFCYSSYSKDMGEFLAKVFGGRL